MYFFKFAVELSRVEDASIEDKKVILILASCPGSEPGHEAILTLAGALHDYFHVHIVVSPI